MVSKITLLWLGLLAGCWAAPAEVWDVTMFYPRTDPNARIVGGSLAASGSHPHMAALTSGTSMRGFFCGGSLVSQRTIVTAAHCVQAVYSGGSLSPTLRVTLGTTRWDTGGFTYMISHNVTHPNYLANFIKNDIALLITTTVVNHGNLIHPVVLNLNSIGGRVPVRVAGWGRTVVSGTTSGTLRELRTTTLDGPECIEAAARASIILGIAAPPVEPHIEICTFHSAGHGNCNGDSGSALTLQSDGSQIGVVSWGFPCALGAPDMFARVSSYGSWLSQNII